MFLFCPTNHTEAVPRPQEIPTPCKLRSRFGRNVRKLRTRDSVELTQEALAERCDLSLRYLQHIEAGVYWPSLPKLAVLRKHLRCSWDELLDGC